MNATSSFISLLLAIYGKNSENSRHRQKQIELKNAIGYCSADIIKMGSASFKNTAQRYKGLWFFEFIMVGIPKILYRKWNFEGAGNTDDSIIRHLVFIQNAFAPIYQFIHNFRVPLSVHNNNTGILRKNACINIIEILVDYCHYLKCYSENSPSLARYLSTSAAFGDNG